MSQNRLALPTWSYAMEKYPPTTIVELGTDCGGFTCALGVHAWRIKAQIHTFNLNPAPTSAFLPLSDLLPIAFHVGDCFDPAVTQKIADYIRVPGITYVLCDAGDKPREFNLFSQYLKPGDVIAAHDYYVDSKWWGWGEISKHQVVEAVEANNLVPFFQEHFDTAGWLAYKKQ